MPQTVAIIEELASNGYTHHICSNIGLTAFQALVNPQQFPQFAHIFKYFDISKSHVATYQNDNGDKKNQTLFFFRHYLIKNNIDFSKHESFLLMITKQTLPLRKR